MRIHSVAGRRSALIRARRNALAATICALLSIVAHGVRANEAQLSDSSGDDTQGGTNDAKPAKDRAVTLKKVEVTADALKADPAATYTESVISPDVVRNLSPGPSITAQTMLNQEP